MKAFSEFALACLVVSLCACKPGSATSGDNPGVTELKDRLWKAIQAKSADKFIDCYFIEERFKSAAVREENRKAAEYLLQRETIDIQIENIPPNDLPEVKRIQSAHPATQMRYSLDPKMMLKIRQKPDENGNAGHSFFIGEQKGKWFIVTMAGHTT